MARWWIGLLLLLNVALLAWNLGALAPWGLGSDRAQAAPSVTLAIQAPASEPASEPASAASAAAPSAAPKPAASAPRPKPAAAAAADSESN